MECFFAQDPPRALISVCVFTSLYVALPLEGVGCDFLISLFLAPLGCGQ